MLNKTYFLVLAAAVMAGSCATVHAQTGGRSAWMWTSSSDPYGAANILGDHAKEGGLIVDFLDQGFDRIYTSLGSWPVSDPDRVAHWNASLDDAGIQSQMLLGEASWIFPASRPGLLNIIQTRLIDYNDSRTDPRELIDAVHLDIEPHALSQWSSSTNAERRDFLLLMGETYDEVRALLDSSGQTQVEIYADLPVWFDSSSSIGWDPGERDQWFVDLGESLDGFSMMAYERDSLSHIASGVGWEIANFNGEVRVGLEAQAVGPGETWADFDELMDMADALDNLYGNDFGGVDFHALRHFAAQVPFSFLPGDVNGDGFVGIDDLNAILSRWNQAVELGNWGQGDIAGTGDGFVGISDLNVVLANWNAGTPPGATANVPEPTSLALLAGFAGLASVRRTRS